MNAETPVFSWDRYGPNLHGATPPVTHIHEHHDDWSPVLSHSHDVEDYQEHEEQRLRHEHMHFKEVHHPYMDQHFDSYGDHYHHMWPTSDFQLPRQATDYSFYPYAHDYGYRGYHRGQLQNKLPAATPAKENS